MRLRKYENPKVKKAWKITTILVAVLISLTSIGLITFGVLHLAGVVDLTNDEARVYSIRFFDSESDTVYYETSMVRGEKLKYTFEPSKSGYTFRGWDLNGDTFKDIIPSHVYNNINARALWAPIVERGLNNALR